LEIEGELKCSIIIYMGFSIPIIPDDIPYFEEMLHEIPYSSLICLILFSDGGALDTADNIIKLVRNTTKDKQFKVIIPERAKSAATLICLGSDEIIMGDTSELGPIDPLIPVYTPNGMVYRPA
jgi:ClpP class serine protease